MIDKNNLTMLTDFYELTMANGYFENNLVDKIVYFDMFFRKIPDRFICSRQSGTSAYFYQWHT